MSYYKIIDGQAYDRKVLELAEALVAGQGDGRISQADAKQLYEAVQDGNLITAIENATLFYLLETLNFTDRAAAWLYGKVVIRAPIELPSRIQSILSDEFDVPRLEVVYKLADIKAQEALSENQRGFIQALRIAVETILLDGNDQESPRAIVKEVFELFPGEVENAEEKIQLKVREFLSTGTLQLLPNLNWSDRDQDFDFSPPENGEMADTNWIFSLYLPDLSDHLYWIIIDRATSGDAYIYGFN